MNHRNGRALTNRCLQVLQLAADGGTTQTTADVLMIDLVTCKHHRSRLMADLSVKTMAHAVAEGFRQGLLK